MIFHLSWSINDDGTSISTNLMLENAGREIKDTGALVGIDVLFNQIYLKWCSKYDKDNNLKWK